MRVNMEIWNDMTRSFMYAEWHPIALKVCEYVKEYPTDDYSSPTGKYRHVFTFLVRNEKAKNKRRRLLKIGLTKDGELEYFAMDNDSAPKPIWYVEEAVKKTFLLYDAFERFGIVRR